MSVQVLNDRSCRRIQRSTGETVLRAWANGGYVFEFVTPEHRHGWWDKKTGGWGWIPDEDVCHFTSCKQFEKP